MISRTLASCTLAVGFAAGALWVLPVGGHAGVLQAYPQSPDLDSDDDFLPDQVEWACLTNAQSADTDQDDISDFVEVVQRANPRLRNGPLPPDHEMRVVVTTTQGPAGNEVTLHLLFRFMGDTSLLTSLDAWAELAMAPGTRFPLADVTSGPISIHQRLVPGEGLWVRVSACLVSEAMLRAVLPCTIGADATIGTRNITTKVPIIDRSGTTVSLVPYGPALFAVQSIGALPPSSYSSINNRICVLQLQPAGGGTGGTAYEVTGAECQDCNDLVCGVDCANSIGTILILPAGAGSITGG